MEQNEFPFTMGGLRDWPSGFGAEVCIEYHVLSLLCYYLPQRKGGTLHLRKQSFTLECFVSSMFVCLFCLFVEIKIIADRIANYTQNGSKRRR